MIGILIEHNQNISKIAISIGIALFSFEVLTDFELNYGISRYTFGAGIVMIAFSAINGIHQTSFIFIVLSSKYIQGATAVLTYQKIYQSFKNRSTPDLGMSIKNRVLIWSLVFFFLLVSNLGIILLSEMEVLFPELKQSSIIILSFSTVIVSTAGIFIKLSDGFDKYTLLGIALFISGAEIYELPLDFEVFILIVGIIIYSTGYWLAFVKIYSDLD